MVSSSTDSIFVGTIAEPAITIITASGLLEEFFGPPWYYEHGDPTDGWTDPGGVFNWSLMDCERCVKWVVTDSVGAQGGGSFADYDNGNALKETYADTQIVKGTVMFRWHKGPVFVASWCQPACFTYNGTVSVSAQPMAADLELHAPNAILASQNFTATVNPSPRQLAGFDVPMRVVSWSFQPDGSSSATICTTDTLCVNAPSGSGTLTVQAYVNGDLKTKSQYITVLSCLTGDSLLDDPNIRRALKAAWDGSNASGPQSGRVERVGGRFGGSPFPIDTTFDALAGANACRGWGPGQWTWNSPGLGPPEVVWHTHPWYFGEVRNNGICPERGTPRPGGMDDRPSPNDILPYEGIPIIVVARDRIFVTRWNNGTVPPSVLPTQAYSRAACNATEL
ncbi:MAG TPA: hypothetical protein VFN22_04250 [Gemmatimonadales bacterium]|nr:hypothetical protein [Gemmatimonadales bacterium]